MPFRLSFQENDYFNRFLLLILTHIPFLYPLYFLLFLILRLIFTSIPNFVSILDIFFFIFNVFLPLSHIIFLSLTSECPLKSLESLKLEIQRNLGIFLNPDNSETKDLIDKNMKIEVSFLKILINLVKMGLIIGLEAFSAFEFGVFQKHWCWKEGLFLIFGFIYCSNFGFKIYEKLGLKSSKILFYSNLLVSFGIMRSFCELFFL